LELVERDGVLRQLEALLAAVARGSGHTACVAGEAGVGKTSLLKALAERRGDAALWWGACDALQTPQPLAPLLDVARSADVGFRALLGSGAPPGAQPSRCCGWSRTCTGPTMPRST
jgi:predicted ATPase